MRWVGRHGAGRRLALPPVPRSSGPCAGERAAGNRGPSFPASPPPAGILLDPQTRRGWDRSGVVDAPRRSVLLRMQRQRTPDPAFRGFSPAGPETIHFWLGVHPHVSQTIPAEKKKCELKVWLNQGSSGCAPSNTS
ncbi:uncharacterized protein LOC117795392 isoform X2 [Ailuropoda melanoleuca]|uniref:uncharacterized protein LOC117795392 isoform X2 n=1 Tax=Ailuropoda melanoleuca TaxID=9646 RepID=UPI001494B897|nr:uncharacterized protein LOC117795392 isoform X2 [Ailuropoda melanoleuca]